jgi:hypothetical protein
MTTAAGAAPEAAMFEFIVLSLLALTLLFSIVAAKLAFMACQDANDAKKAINETQILLIRTMNVNAWFHACTHARLRGEPEPPKPDFN